MIATVPQLLYTNVMTWLGNRTLRQALDNLSIQFAEYPEAVGLLREVYADDQQLLFVGASAGLGVIAALIAAHFANNLRTRIATLGASAARIAAGDVDTPVGLTGRSEMGRLGSTLEQVRATLAQRIALEQEARALEKDLALAATVDKMLLPTQDRIEGAHFQLAAFHRGAARCSGAFWAYHLEREGEVWLLVGDVSGTGPGPAMVAASVITSFRTALRGGGLDDVEHLLGQMHHTVAATAGDKHPTAVALLLLGAEGRIRFWSAGSSPLLLVPRDAEPRFIEGGGECLGAGPSAPMHELSIAEGDLLLCMTSGLFAADLRGQKGRTALANLVRTLPASSPLRLRDGIASALPLDAPMSLTEDVMFAAIARTKAAVP